MQIFFTTSARGIENPTARNQYFWFADVLQVPIGRPSVSWPLDPNSTIKRPLWTSSTYDRYWPVS
jgi:hypothetical protein